MEIFTNNDNVILYLKSEDGNLSNVGVINDFIAKCWENQAQVLAMDIGCFCDEFFDLKSRFLGEVAQKFVNYNIKLAIIGDISSKTSISQSLKDFVYESNKGNSIWFLNSIDELKGKFNG